MEELQPEIINNSTNKRMEPPMQDLPLKSTETPPASKPAPEEPKIVSEESLKEMGTKIASMALELWNEDLGGKIKSRDEELSKYKTDHEGSEKAHKENYKKKDEEHKKKLKDTETKHKNEIKNKDTILANLKKSLDMKDKDVKALFKQVKEALNSDE